MWMNLPNLIKENVTRPYSVGSYGSQCDRVGDPNNLLYFAGLYLFVGKITYPKIYTVCIN